MLALHVIQGSIARRSEIWAPEKHVRAAPTSGVSPTEPGGPVPTSMWTQVRAVHDLNDEPQLGTLCCMALQSREGMHSILSFMSCFWQQFTYWGNFKQNLGWVCLLPSLPSKRIQNRAQDGPRNAMPELAWSTYVGPHFCPICPVVFSPAPCHGSPSHARLV